MSRRIAAIADPEMRVRYLASTLRDLPVGRIADVLTVAVSGAETRDPELSPLMLALCVALASPELARRRSGLVRAAIEQGQHDTANLLQPRPAARESERTQDVPDFGFGRAVSLGERKSLARRRDRDLLARVIRDPSPDVIRILLGNPALTEDDVVRMCARRPIHPDVLREVYLQLRWIVRYPVRRTIVRNPFAPLDMALPLCTLLNRQDAREVAASPELDLALRERCARVAGIATRH
ncbi:MAG: hypothetical protein AB8I08_12925 [Sandaracinaceae bacterium]